MNYFFGLTTCGILFSTCSGHRGKKLEAWGGKGLRGGIHMFPRQRLHGGFTCLSQAQTAFFILQLEDATRSGTSWDKRNERKGEDGRGEIKEGTGGKWPADFHCLWSVSFLCYSTLPLFRRRGAGKTFLVFANTPHIPE